MRRTINGLAILGLERVPSTTTFAQGKGNGKGGGGGDDGGGGVETPPIYYQAQKFTMPYGSDSIWLFDGNSFGQDGEIVGRAVGGMYAPYDETTETANFDTPKGPTDQLAFYYDAAIDPTMAFDLNTIVQGIPDHLLIRRATSINEKGLIAVYLDNPDDTVQNFFPGIVDTNVSPPQLHLIDFDWVDDGSGNVVLRQNTLVQDTLTDYDGDYGIPLGLNDVGDMLVRYRRNGSAAGLYVFNFGFTDLTRRTPEPVDLGVNVGYVNYSNLINNPTDTHEAQIAFLPFNSDGTKENPLVIELAYDGTTGLTPGSVNEITPKISAS